MRIMFSSYLSFSLFNIISPVFCALCWSWKNILVMFTQLVYCMADNKSFDSLNLKEKDMDLNNWSTFKATYNTVQ